MHHALRKYQYWGILCFFLAQVPSSARGRSVSTLGSIEVRYVAYATAGYIPRAHRCSHCKWSLGKLYVHNDKHVYRRCCNEDCRRRTNVLTQAKWLQNLCRFSLSPMQLHSLLLQYTGTHVGATASPYVLARSVGTTYKPVAELIQRLRAVESQAGQKMNNRSRMSGAVELDATSLRKIRIGKDTQKYKHLVEQWKKAIGPGWALCLL